LEEPTLSPILEAEVVFSTPQGFRGREVLVLESIIACGAEALLIRGKFMGLPAIVKWRPQKPYRHPLFDKRLRYERTLAEAKTLHRAKKLGVLVPSVFYVDPDSSIIIMEYIDGKIFKEYINELSIDDACTVSREVGKYAALLHSDGIAHGDLTTSNVVVKGEDVYLIDFGLSVTSADLEDVGIDVHIYLRSLESAHYALCKELFECFMQGYRAVAGSDYAEKVLRKVKEIRLRGRYVKERRRVVEE